MKDSYPNKSLVRFCRLFGITRQAYYKHFWQWEATTIEQDIILRSVKHLRELHPVMGGRKLYALLQQDMLHHQIKMGRDALFDLLATHKLLVRKRRRKSATTNSKHWYRKYPNLIRGMAPSRSNQLWVSDITYWRTPFGFLYITFITDVYSHKIIGYQLADNLEAINNEKALRMALSTLPPEGVEGLVHHSDRGIQYCCQEYVELLKSNSIAISMTENGDPLENAVAERLNGIIKNEYLLHKRIQSKSEARTILESCVNLYNNQRPHLSINYITPAVAHNLQGVLNRQWKNYYSRKKPLSTQFRIKEKM